MSGRIIFAVGARRSGTNWLQRILAARPDVVAMPTETYLFSHGLQPLAERIQHANPNLPQTAKAFMPRDVFLDAARDFADRVFAENLRLIAPDARYVIERTPWHVYHLDLIAAVYPDAPIVHIIRDGRDVTRSLRSQSWGPKSMAEAAEEWRSSVSAGRSTGGALPRYIEVHYERLLADPEMEIGTLYERLDLDLSSGELEQAVLAARSAFNVDPVFPTIGSGKWRGALSPSDLRTFDRIAGPLLEELGYQREAPPSAGAHGTLVHAATRARSRAREAIRPRQAATATFDRAYARRSADTRKRNAGFVQRLEEELASGRHEVLDEELTPTAQVRIVDAGGTWSGRGPDGAAHLRAALEQHYARRPTLLSGDFHPGSDAFTVVETYALDDGTVWSRTLVVALGPDGVRALTLYRHRLAVEEP